MASSTGLVTFHAESTRAQKTPSGTPIRAHNPTATSTMPMVLMVSTQYMAPNRPHIVRPAPAMIPILGVRTSDPTITVKMTTWYHGRVKRKSLTMFSSKKSNGHLTALRNHSALTSIQSTIWSNQWPIGSWNWSRTLVSDSPTPSTRPVQSPVSAARITGTPPAQSHLPTAPRDPSPP